MAESIFGDCMAQYQPGWEPEPDNVQDDVLPELALLNETHGRAHPDFEALTFHLTRLHLLGFDTNESDTLDIAKALLQVADAQRARRLAQPPMLPEPIPSVVYYMKMRDLIKIGYTTGLVEKRRRALMADRVLATEPGGFDLEQRRLKQFAEYRYVGERFYPGDELMAHIAALKEKQ